MHPYFDRAKPHLFGHRGASGERPENTLPSFERALSLGAPCVELDVQLCDGQLLVFHDDRLERTTNGSGFFADHGFDQLRALDAGHGAQIPTLDEALSLIDRRAGVNIELKGPGTALPVLACVQRLVAAGWEQSLLMVSSFDWSQLRALRAADGEIRLGVLSKHWQPAVLAEAEALQARSVHLSRDSVTAEAVARLRGQGLRSYVYTVNADDEIERMRALGVDGVFSNFPERVLAGNVDRLPAGWQ
jgi:glycerophosphoryl diester phosphodiesterase